MQSDYSIVCQNRFIEATRDSGYKGTESALSELIDNSLQAGANRVTIRMMPNNEGDFNSGPGRPKMSRVDRVAIVDNGRGMDSELLRRALRFGDSNRFNDRSGLGRFGMGLPNASVSQCKRVWVYSWQKGQHPFCTHIDVDEIASGKMQEVPKPESAEIPRPYEDMIDVNKGTLVVWEHCDRLDHDGKHDTLERSLKHSIGRIFRYFLTRDIEISINGKAIEPFDPLYRMPDAKLPDDLLAKRHCGTLEYEIPIPNQPDRYSAVEVDLLLLPEEWQLKYGKDKKALRKRHIPTTEGFSIVRAKREIDLIKNPYLKKHWTDRWYRVEVRFDPELDEVFGVTHTKQHVSFKEGSSIFEKLRTEISTNVNAMKDIIIARGKEAHTAKAGCAEETVQRVIGRLKPIETLTQKADSQVASEVQEYIEKKTSDKSDDERQQLEERISKCPVLMEYEQQIGAPFYRTKVVGRAVIALLNTAHPFYERVYRRIEEESPQGKTGIDLLIMALARSEAMGGEELRDWYDDQRHEWSQHVKAFVKDIDEPEESDPAGGTGS